MEKIVEKKKRDIVGVGPNPVVKNPQWTRVHGADIQPGHKTRSVQNLARSKDPAFDKACELAGVKCTARQASKWNNEKGAAYNIANRIEMNGFATD